MYMKTPKAGGGGAAGLVNKHNICYTTCGDYSTQILYYYYFTINKL
jgi:hypothetical protein